MIRAYFAIGGLAAVFVGLLFISVPWAVAAVGLLVFIDAELWSFHK